MTFGMNSINNKKLEALIYSGLWLIAIILFLLDLMRVRSYTALPLLDMNAIGHLTLILLPFIALFAINNYLLIPKLQKRGDYTKYLLWTLCSIIVIWIWQQFQFLNFSVFEHEPDFQDRTPHPGPHPLLPLPVFLDLIYDFLIVGLNLAISLIFQQVAVKFQHESLMKENAENQLTYLKAQINPHFYMNMLNNIHGMIEIDSEKAQEMVIGMSSLMRYMLYDSSNTEIELSAEIKFIRDYLSMMRERYPEAMVQIYSDLPEAKDVSGIRIPPLLFLVFLENAFKHGISYSSDSFVSVSLSLESGRIVFKCMNSLHKKTDTESHEGIGLGNVKRRLDIIFGNQYTLDIDRTNSVYTVVLTCPPYEVENVDN